MQSNSSDKYVYHYNIEILNLFDPELQQIKTKTMIKNSDLNGDLNGELLSDSDLNGELLSNLKKFKVQTILILECKIINYHKIFHSITEIIISDSSKYASKHYDKKNYASKRLDCLRCNYKAQY